MLQRCFIDSPTMLRVHTEDGGERVIFPCIVRRSTDDEAGHEVLSIELTPDHSAVLGWITLPVETITSAVIVLEISISEDASGSVVAQPSAADLWSLINEYRKANYSCGVRAGEQIRVRHDIPIRSGDASTEHSHRAGEIWEVLTSSRIDPGTVWLRRPSGERCTWSDDGDFWNHFERIQR